MDFHSIDYGLYIWVLDNSAAGLGFRLNIYGHICLMLLYALWSLLTAWIRFLNTYRFSAWSFLEPLMDIWSLYIGFYLYIYIYVGFLDIGFLGLYIVSMGASSC